MKSTLRKAYLAELALAAAAERSVDFDAAFEHLARAHILSQRFTLRHTAVHLHMLRLGWKRHDWREVRGQVTRSIAALLFSRIWVPLGNTGRADVSAVKPMPIPADLAALLDIEQQIPEA